MKTDNLKIELSTLVPRLEQEGAVVLLESQLHEHPAARKSYIAALPQKEFWGYEDQVFTAQDGNIQTESGINPWEALKAFQRTTDGWLFGYLGYDLKNCLGMLHSNNADITQTPDFYMMNPGLLIEIYPQDSRIIKGELPAEFLLNDGKKQGCTYSIQEFQPAITETEYCSIIQQAKAGIREGDYYEINLSHQMRGTFSGTPYRLYSDMKEAGPVPFGAYMSFGDGVQRWNVCCASPERFLAKEGHLVYSQPIKGTIHRGATEAEDRELLEWLRSSEKNRAENLMIVDLVRNDLGRIAQNGTVRVQNLFEIQSFETVHQMVSTIEALADDWHPFDIIRACFPMGSMTGAPKISAMQAIEKLEDYRRGIYSGAIGYLTPEGDFDFNVVIRSAIIRDNQLVYPVGGAVTSDSDPKSEWEETLVKARALTAVQKDKIPAT